jgi:predicted amidohydrolase YtcJ
MGKQAMSNWLPVNPDLIMFNGHIITVDSDFSIAEAVAVKDARIMGVGTNADIKILAGKNTRLLWDARHYIIHTDFATPECIERMAKNNIGANVQSAIKWTIGNLMIKITGEKRAAYHWPLKTLFDKGVIVTNSSDASVTYPDWRQGVESTVLRKDKATGEVLGPEQCISVEAVRSYTINGAWQDHQDHIRGSIEVGKLADFTVIGEDILTIDPPKIHAIPVIYTIVGGKTVYENPEY